jgi:hypothetical protein
VVATGLRGARGHVGFMTAGIADEFLARVARSCFWLFFSLRYCIICLFNIYYTFGNVFLSLTVLLDDSIVYDYFLQHVNFRYKA